MFDDDFDYGRAEADLEDSDCPWADEIYDYQSDKGRDEFMRENGLDPDRYRRSSGGTHGSSGTEGCFLTTACVVAKGLPDDCDELQTLRWFRDNRLRQQPDGEAMIRRYYEIAPQIVEKINTLPDAQERWQRMYAEKVCPCVETIRSGEYEAAFQMYKDWVSELGTAYLSPKPTPQELREKQEEICARIGELREELEDFEQTRIRNPGTQEHEYDLQWALHLNEEIRKLEEIAERLADSTHSPARAAFESAKPLVLDPSDFRYLNV